MITHTGRVTVSEYPARQVPTFNLTECKTDLIFLLLTHLQVCQQADGERVELLQPGLHLQQNAANVFKVK